MRTFSSRQLTLVLVLILSANNVYAHCKTKAVVYYPTVVYNTPVVYKDAEEPIIPMTNCGSCEVYSEREWVPGHWHGNAYEVYYNSPDVYPTPYAYHEDYAYEPNP